MESSPSQTEPALEAASVRRGGRVGGVILLAAWMVFVALPPLGLTMVRERLLAWQSSPAVQAEWDRFREAMREETDGSGPVKRKVPKSAEPPLKVWLRDYFELAIVTWVVFGSIVFLVTWGLARGALGGRSG